MVMSAKILKLMVGIPGSGKSTRALELVKENPDTFYLSADAIRAEVLGDEADNTQNARVFGIFNDRLKTLMVKGHSVVVDNTNYSRKNRKDILRLAKTMGYTVYAYEMSTPHDVSKERNLARARIVPTDVMERMIAGYASPDPLTEYIEKVFIV
jgi:predicted kinase